MTHFTPININDEVKVKLTEEGRKVVDEYWKPLLRHGGHTEIPSEYRRTDKEGRLTLQLWDVMAILGPHIYMGGPQLIEGNIIHFPNATLTS